MKPLQREEKQGTYCLILCNPYTDNFFYYPLICGFLITHSQFHHNSPKLKLTFSNVLFCPKPKEIQFSNIADNKKDNIHISVSVSV